MSSHRRHAIVLVLLMGIVALLAQLAGVSGPRTNGKAVKRSSARTLAVVPGGSVPDITSTTLASTKIRAGQDETIRMVATAHVRVTAAKRGATQVVCGIRYSRDGDASWSLGTPYETITLKRRGAAERVRIERTFNAPAGDTYRMKTSCHVSTPARGATVTAKGTMKARLGMPAGAAIPVE